MVRFVLSLACLLVAGDCFGQCSGVAAPSCSGVARATPVRNLIAAKPVATILSKICSNAQARRSAACSGQRASCSGSAVPMAPAPQAGACGCANCKCADCNCGSAAQPVASSTYSQALASAQYRAANRNTGHSYLDTHRTSGVGWSTNNPKPNTCLGGDNGVSYASVQGSDGYFYSTKFQ